MGVLNGIDYQHRPVNKFLTNLHAKHMLWHMPSNKTPQTNQNERHVRLFRNGRNQAIRIPREFEMEGEEAIIHKEGDRLILEPVRKGKLLTLLATLKPLEESFPDIDDSLPPLDDVEL